MRLTLRTLLAYLDDMLEPADTKIIGQKIHESPMAQLLVSRIREVMRRRRLKAPDISGPEMGIDPNIVAQYLDNTLPAERYADVERVLLASDEMLAEAAACHEVLTVDPPEISFSMRERLHALGPVDEASQLMVPADPPATVTNRTPHSIPIRSGIGSSTEGLTNAEREQQSEAITTVPDYLKQSAWSSRAFPSAIVALLVLVSAALLAPEFWTRIRQANNEIKRKDDRDKLEGISPADASLATNHEAETDAAEIASRLESLALSQSLPAVKVETKRALEGLDPAPPKDDDDETPVVAASPESAIRNPKRESDTESTDIESAIKPSNSQLTDELPPAPDAVTVKREPVKDVPITYSSNEGILLRHDPANRHWFMVPRRSALHPGEVVANIEPFDGTLDFDKKGIRTTLIGETVVNLLVPAEAGVAGLGIQRGKLVIQNGRKDEQPAAIGIAIGDDIWLLELTSRDTLCGVEVMPRQSSHFQKLVDEHWYQATLYVISGSVKWTNREGKSLEIAEHLALNIVPEKNLQVRSHPISFPSTPDWCDSAKRKAMPIRKHQSLVQFEREFELDVPIDETMLNLVKNSKFPKISELAAQCLSATDDYRSLVETLAECPHEEARFAARDGLRRWLPLQPDRAAKLKEALESYYPPADADAVYQMLWGFSREDVINSKVNSWLFINWMRSPKVEVRELADFWVEKLMEKRTDFKAMGGTAAHRETQVRRLEELIERNNGLIKAP